MQDDSISLLRRQLLAGSGAALAAAGVAGWSRDALAADAAPAATSAAASAPGRTRPAGWERA